MAGTQVEPGFVEPDYAGRSLGDVLPAVAQALGVPVGFHESSLVLPPAPAYVVMLVDGLGYDLLAEHRVQAPYLHSLLGQTPHDQAPATCGVPSTTATSLTSLGTSADARTARPGRVHLAGARDRGAAQLAVLGQAGRPAGVAAEPDRVRAARGGRGAHERGQQARVPRLRTDPVRPARCGVRRRRRHRRADRRRGRGGRAAAVADLCVRRRPRLARPPRRRRLAALAGAAARHRRGRAGDARRAARRRTAAGRRRPRDGRLDEGVAHRHRRAPVPARRRRRCSAARRGSATSTAAAAPSTTSRPPGAAYSATGPRC